ncbi:hypothetical protein [Solemya elarraichensis gill symbiont]|uniref:Uncharacterized protein n=1 Tax=Solemya elarraichensis gill symbiont TaxID=1918949 RepID=A0A1T2L3K4_9GAMM|nr:hypothetical protein [Solemya elarraichensis gill symbiont]OOZ39649.1 hypothetical protein BOW52_07035 [Solemya elarraichensis gill symbiont]
MKGFHLPQFWLLLSALLFPVITQATGFQVEPITLTIFVAPILLPISLALQLAYLRNLRKRSWPRGKQQVTHFLLPMVGQMILLALFCIYLLFTKHPEYRSVSDFDMVVLPIVAASALVIISHGNSIRHVVRKHRKLQPKPDAKES